MRNRLVIGNWKMLCPDEPASVVTRISRGAERSPSVRVVLCPPYTLLASTKKHGRHIEFGGQDCHSAREGAFTGGISAALLRRAGASHVLVGHSERRLAGDDDGAVRCKAENAASSGLTAVICVGETRAERDAGETELRLGQQVAGCLPDRALPVQPVFAYEPVWAIGADVTPAYGEIAAAVAAIRQAVAFRAAAWMQNPLVLYGGSVTASNSESLAAVAGLDGLLVGKASLDPCEFTAIVESAR